MSEQHSNQGGQGGRNNRGNGGRSGGRGQGGRSQQGRGGAPRTGQHGDRGGDRPQRGPRVSAARLTAYDVLRDVTDREAYANLALPARIREAGLDHRDAALVTELVAGSLRWRGRYDRIIELASGREVDKIDPRTLNVLRLGVHQLLSMRTASHAAVNESVELQRLVANIGGAGFVNGVLRQIGRSTPEEWDEQIDAAAKNADEALAAKASHPAWVLRALRAALAAEGRADELEELLAADNDAPRVSIVQLPGFGDRDEVSELEELRATGISPIGYTLRGGDPSQLFEKAGLENGALRVQDQGSQIAALALTRARDIEPGEKWLDLCSGPGGKTAILGAEARIGGATVRANEVSPHRADLVRDSVVAVSDVVEVVSFDGRSDDAYGDQQFDRILVDAPCSGLGALRRRPEARWRKQPSDLPDLTQLQSELLDAAVAHLKPGGLLAYVTCSPHQAETRAGVERLLKRHEGVEEIDAVSIVEGLVEGKIDLPGANPSVQLWPHRHGTDAMFIALFTKN